MKIYLAFLNWSSDPHRGKESCTCRSRASSGRPACLHRSPPAAACSSLGGGNPVTIRCCCHSPFHLPLPLLSSLSLLHSLCIAARNTSKGTHNKLLSLSPRHWSNAWNWVNHFVCLFDYVNTLLVGSNGFCEMSNACAPGNFFEFFLNQENLCWSCT